MINIPYLRKSGSFEKAKGIGHVPIIQSEYIQKKLDNYRVVFNQNLEPPLESIFCLKEEINKSELPRYALSFDGSNSEVALDDRFPSTRIGYLQLSAVFVFLEKILSIQKNSFIDPSKLMDTISESLYSIALPGTNICREDCSNIKDSWRQEIFDLFREYKIENIPLLDVYMNLMSFSSAQTLGDKIILDKCPASENCMKNIPVAKEGLKCPICEKQLYPTDALRIHEDVKEIQSNISALNHTMSCLEHINLVGYLQYLINRRPDALKSIAFIIDGPLATFGWQHWLHNVIFNFINNALYKTLDNKNLEYPIIVGVEKTGAFVEHAKAINKFLKPQSIMVLLDDYIYTYIRASKPTKYGYGNSEYYGQKLYYKTKTSQILTITIPRTKKGKFDIEILDHPALLRTLHLLDNIGTIIYEDALIPIALAHSFASIPLKTGSKVLRILSQEKLNLT